MTSCPCRAQPKTIRVGDEIKHVKWRNNSPTIRLDNEYYHRKLCSHRPPNRSELYILLPAHFDKNEGKWHNIGNIPPLECRLFARVHPLWEGINRYQPLFKELCPHPGDFPLLKFIQLNEQTYSVTLVLPMFGPDIQLCFDDDVKLCQQVGAYTANDVAIIILQYASNSQFTTEMAICLDKPAYVDVCEFTNDGTGARPVPQLMNAIQKNALQGTVNQYYCDILKALGRGGHAYNTRSRKRKW